MRLAASWTRPRRFLASALAGASVFVVGACSGYTPSYDMNDKVNPGLVSAIHSFADNLSNGQAAPILLFQTVPAFEAGMQRFVDGYLAHAVQIVSIKPAGDQLVSAHLAITCGTGDVQRVEVVWSWRDEGWKGWPAAARISAVGKVSQYQGCRDR